MTTPTKLIAFGIPFKTSTQRRYVLVSKTSTWSTARGEHEKIQIEKRSDSIETIRVERRRFRDRSSRASTIIDTETGDEVPQR